MILDVLKTYSYENVLTAQLSDVQTILPNYKPSEGDVLMIEKEASAYREMHLRAEFNELSKAFFLATATGTNLDYYADFYDVERLQGAKPTADYRFELTAPLSYSVLIPKDSILVDDGGVKAGVLLDDMIFEPSIEVQTGKVELQEFVSTSEVSLTTLQTPLPYVGNIEATDIFRYGAEVENDESLRGRILISMADKSTAGAEMTYRSYTYSADARILDVNVFNDVHPISTYINSFANKNESEVYDSLIDLFADFCTVKVILFVPSDIDDTAIDRVSKALNSTDIRPLTDRIKVIKAKKISFDIVATLHIFPNRNLSEVYSKALENLNLGLKSLKKIGVDITKSEINDFLRVDGVKKVDIIEPFEIIVDRESIAIMNTINITPEVYYEQL